MAHTLCVSIVYLISSMVVSSVVLADDKSDDEADFFSLPIEELFDIEVISAGKKAENIFEVSAAVHVITNDDIRRSGATSIPELLRMVPGVHVSRLDANKWSISARGFNFRFANKLLVLIDGRSIYTHSFSGVYWEQHQLIMDDIDRIEVIRGPGATLWGANAVNGVINIITRSSRNTEGGYAKLGVGSDGEKVEYRHGFKLNTDDYAKLYVLSDQHNSYITTQGNPANDDWSRYQGGFRIDSTVGDGAEFTLSGDFYRANYHQFIGKPVIDPPTFSIDALIDRVDASGYYLLGRYEVGLGEKVTTSVQLFFDSWERNEEYLDQDSETFDIEILQKNRVSDRHDIIWGVGYRTVKGEFSDDTYVAMIPGQSDWSIWNGFIQDEISFYEGKGSLVLGSKFEKGELSDIEVQPNIRMHWRFSDRQSAWWAISKAVRTPSISNLQADVTFFPISFPSSPLPVVGKLYGDTELDSEVLTAFEIGYRLLWKERVKTDLNLFYHEYEDLIFEIGKPFVLQGDGTYFEYPMHHENAGTGRAHGAELSVDWSLREDWRINVAYTYLEMDLNPTQPIAFFYETGAGGTSPKNSLSVQSLYNVNSHLQLDAWLRYYGDVWSYLSNINEKAESYWDLDLRLAWRASDSLELQLVAHDILEPERVEGFSEAYDLNTVQIQRGIYGVLEYRFD